MHDEPDTTVGSTAPAQDPPRDQLVRAYRDGLEVREVPGDGTPPLLAGHFAVFNDWTEINSRYEGRFMERISPGAFRKTMSENAGAVRVTLNHGADPMLGDKPLGSIRSMSEDETGAAYEVDLFRGIPDLVMDGLRAGEYGASFRFSVIRDDVNRSPERSTHNPDGLPERTITEIRLHEFGPVTFPAYAGATAKVRSLTDKFIPDADIDEKIGHAVREHLKNLAPSPTAVEAEAGSAAKPPPPAPTRVTPAAHIPHTRKDTPTWRLP